MTQSTRPATRWYLDPILLLLAVAGVAVGSYSGATGHTEDIDERLFRSTLVHMQAGEGYYDAFAEAIEEKSGVGPSQVRSVRTPVVSELVAPFPSAAWRWLAAVPAFVLVLGAAALAGPRLLERRIAAALASVWMVVSLPLLYLHAELWGAGLLAFAMAEEREERDLPAALLCLAATLTRELFGISLVVGLLVGRRRRPWLGALAAAVGAAAVHATWARRIVDPAGFDPPLRATEPYLRYLSPGTSGVAQGLGGILLGAAVLGAWRWRHRAGAAFVMLCTVPLVVATALAGRAYWTLTWCAVTSAMGATAIGAAVERWWPHRAVERSAGASVS